MAIEIPSEVYGPETRWGSPVLQRLETWLSEHGTDPVVSQLVTEDLWFYQAFDTLKASARPLSMGIGVFEADPGENYISVYLHLPAGFDFDRTKELFCSFDELVGNCIDHCHLCMGHTLNHLTLPHLSLETEYAETDALFEERARENAELCAEEFLGVCRYDLAEDLRANMGREDADAWLDSANTLTYLKPPREMLGTEHEWLIRDMLVRNRYGIFS